MKITSRLVAELDSWYSMNGCRLRDPRGGKVEIVWARNLFSGLNL